MGWIGRIERASEFTQHNDKNDKASARPRNGETGSTRRGDARCAEPAGQHAERGAGQVAPDQLDDHGRIFRIGHQPPAVRLGPDRNPVAQKIQTLFIDDLDGREAEGTVRFGLDGAFPSCW